MTRKKKKEHLRAEDVTPNQASNVLNFLNAAKTAKEISEAVEFPGERDVGIKVAKNILDKRVKLGSFTDLKQVAGIRQIGPERFSEIVKILGDRNRIRYKEDDTMAKKDVEKAKKIIERFDPALVAVAMQEMDVKAIDVKRAKEKIRKVYDSIPTKPQQDKMKVLSKAVAEVELELVQKEIENVKVALREFDRAVLVEAAKDYVIDATSICWFPICICPEGGCPPRIGCLFPEGGCPPNIRCVFPEGGCPPNIRCIYPEGGCPPNIRCIYPEGGCPPSIRCIYPEGGCGPYHIWCDHLIHVIHELDKDNRYNVVVSDGLQVGLLGKCWENVNCSGKSIFVMSKCGSSLYSFDIGVIDPIDAIRKIAETNPLLNKRVDKMIENMKKANEL
jgi:hypothetical protein